MSQTKDEKMKKANQMCDILYIKGHPRCNVTNQRLKDGKFKLNM
jgi:hypothetical protein